VKIVTDVPPPPQPNQPDEPDSSPRSATDPHSSGPGNQAPVEDTSRLPRIRRHDEGQPTGGPTDAGRARSGLGEYGREPTDDRTAVHPIAASAPVDEPPTPSRPVDSGATAQLDPVGPPPTSGPPPNAGPPAYGYSPESAPRFEPSRPSQPLGPPAGSTEVIARRGTGLGGLLGVAGVVTAAVGLFALPLQQQARTGEVFFGQLRGAAAYDFTRGQGISFGPAKSNSLAGDQIATTFWRYGALGLIAALGVFLILTVAWAATRRVGGALLFLAGAGALVYLGLAAPQTNQYYRAITTLQGERVDWGDWKVGFWVAAGGFALAAIGGLIALVTRGTIEEDE
jgi:hypothetical protein